MSSCRLVSHAVVISYFDLFPISPIWIMFVYLFFPDLLPEFICVSRLNCSSRFSDWSSAFTFPIRPCSRFLFLPDRHHLF